MIDVSARVRGGCLYGLSVTGHAGRRLKLGDPVCAAVSVLVRSLFFYLENHPAIEYSFAFPERGEAFLEVTGLPAEEFESWKGVCEFFLLGITSVKADAPRSVDLQICEIER